MSTREDSSSFANSNVIDIDVTDRACTGADDEGLASATPTMGNGCNFQCDQGWQELGGLDVYARCLASHYGHTSMTGTSDIYGDNIEVVCDDTGCYARMSKRKQQKEIKKLTMDNVRPYSHQSHRRCDETTLGRMKDIEKLERKRRKERNKVRMKESWRTMILELDNVYLKAKESTSSNKRRASFSDAIDRQYDYLDEKRPNRCKTLVTKDLLERPELGLEVRARIAIAKSLNNFFANDALSIVESRPADSKSLRRSTTLAKAELIPGDSKSLSRSKTLAKGEPIKSRSLSDPRNCTNSKEAQKSEEKEASKKFYLLGQLFNLTNNAFKKESPDMEHPLEAASRNDGQSGTPDEEVAPSKSFLRRLDTRIRSMKYFEFEVIVNLNERD